ncbi:MAG: GtrA family protein [Thermoguttaceae bacterium]|nr:GtrA family protein [Thermoguttaceae bacterium]
MTEDRITEQASAEPDAKASSPMGELIRYCLIGVTGASLDAVLFWLMTRAGVYYQIANFISVTCGIVNNFFLNAFFNFKTKNRLLRRFCSFYAIGMLGWGVSALLLWLFIEKWEFQPLTSKLAIIFIVTALQFTLNKTFTFARKRS